MRELAKQDTTGLQAGIKCPGCGTVVHCYDPKHSTHFACMACGTYFRREEGRPTEVLKKFEAQDVVVPVIPIGSTGTLKDVAFTVVSFIRKKQQDENTEWIEYLLYSHNKSNYYTLAVYNGHWMLIWDKQMDNLELFNIGFSYAPTYEVRQGYPYRRFKHYVSYFYDITWASGEFDWNVINDSGKVEVREYIDPPDMVVNEITPEGTDWYWGQHIEPKDVAGAFGINMEDMPVRRGVGTLEQPWYTRQWQPMKRFTLLMLFLVFIFYWTIDIFKPPTYVFNEYVTAEKDTASWSGIMPLSIEHINLSETGAVNIEFQTDLDNEWLELSATLVNDNTGKTYEFTKVLEYYHGYEGGESWSEGSMNENGVISHVPAGRYHLNIYPYSESRKSLRMLLRIEQNTDMVANRVWMVLLLLIVPVTQYVLRSELDGERGF